MSGKMFRRPWLLAIGAMLAMSLVACGDEGSDADTDSTETETETTESEGTGAVPNAEVTPLQPEAEGTGVPRPQGPTGTIPAPSPEQTPVSEGEIHEVIIGDDLVVEDMTISAGDSIQWINEDDTSHTISSTQGGAWSRGQPLVAEIATDETITHQFTTPGEYPLVLNDGDVSWTVTVE